MKIEKQNRKFKRFEKRQPASVFTAYNVTAPTAPEDQLHLALLVKSDKTLSPSF